MCHMTRSLGELQTGRGASGEEEEPGGGLNKRKRLMVPFDNGIVVRCSFTHSLSIEYG